MKLVRILVDRDRLSEHIHQLHTKPITSQESEHVIENVALISSYGCGPFIAVGRSLFGRPRLSAEGKLVWFGLLALVWLIRFGLVWFVWFGLFGLVWFLWFALFQYSIQHHH